MTRAIIPCAGFGTRMKMKPNESKEMLLDSTGKPVIDYALDLCEKYGIQPVIMSRPEKKDLNDYIVGKRLILETFYPGKEWTDTVLNSSKYWDEDNILILPDTRFAPQEIIGGIKKGLETYDIVLGLHEINDPKNWCIINSGFLVEKPTFGYHNEENKYYAFGLIGFKKNYGHYLFNELKLQGSVYLPCRTSYLYLDSFRDITRTGVIDDIKT